MTNELSSFEYRQCGFHGIDPTARAPSSGAPLYGLLRSSYRDGLIGHQEAD